MKEINLIEWLPKYLQEYRELKKITDAENPEIAQLYNEIERLMDNQFIHTCNDEGIKRFEDLLIINPEPDDTLDIRITRVLSKWIDSIPYTYKGLIQKLNALCGEGNYSVNLNNKVYALNITVASMTIKQLQDLKQMISYMIPANIIMTLDSTRIVHSNSYIGLAINRYRCIEVNIKPTIEDSVESSFFVGIGVKRYKKIGIRCPERRL